MSMIQQEQILPEFCRIFSFRPRRNVRGPDRVPTGSREGPGRVTAVCIFVVSASHTAPPLSLAHAAAPGRLTQRGRSTQPRDESLSRVEHLEHREGRLCALEVVGEGPELRVLHAALRDPRLGTGPRVRARRGGLQ